MDKIPITFSFEGKEYKGVFSLVAGSGNSARFHLTIDGLHYGQLWLTDHYGWRWASTPGYFEGMQEEFGAVIVAWYQ